MERFKGLLLGTALATHLLRSLATAAGLPLIVSTTVDYAQKTLTINGHGPAGPQGVTTRESP